MPSRLFAAIAAVIVLVSAPLPSDAQQTYTEDFTTTTYKDAVNTTADWNTGAGELKLFPYVPTLAGAYATSGLAYAVSVAGDLAFVADGASGLVVIDISDPTTPAVVGTYDTSGNAVGVAVDGDHAYVVDGTPGLVVIDVSDPTNPTLAGTYDTSGFAVGVAVAGDYAYVADGAPGLVVIDINDPTNPTLAGTYDTSSSATGVAVTGDLAFVADGASGLAIVDISDPTTPALTGTYDTPGTANGLALAGDHAFVADSGGGLQIIDISDPTTPTLAGVYDSPGLAYAVAVAGDLALIADGPSGLHTIDIGDPTMPTLMGTYDTPGFSWTVVVAGEHAFVADCNGGLQVIRVRDFTAPRNVASYNTPDLAHGVAAHGDLVFLTDGLTGLMMFDITDPANPSLVGVYDTPHSAWEVEVAGDLAFVADQSSGLQIIDISDPTTPTQTGSYLTAFNARAVAVAGDLALVTIGPWGLAVIDVADPTSPALLSTYDTPGTATGITVKDNLAFVADQSSGLQIIDISDPTTPTLAGSFNTAGDAFSVVIDGDLAFVADNTAGLQIIDISDPTSPVFVGSYDTPGNAFDVAVDGDFAFIADLSTGLWAIDVSVPALPALLSAIGTSDNANDVTVVGDFAFVGANGAGLKVIQVFQHEFISADNVGRSLAVDGGSDTIVRARVTSTETAGISWELSADGGANWDSFNPDNVWAPLTNAGDELLWRSTLAWSLSVNPTVSDVTIGWRNDFGPIASIADVPDDQGGRVYLNLTRSGYDFADETTNPVTQYGIYRRVDSASLVAQIGRQWWSHSGVEPAGANPLPGVETARVGGTQYVLGSSVAAGTFPPGTWALVATVPATQSDSYIAEVTTEADSSSAGTNYSVFLITTHTTTPSVWFASAPDSGYSVDNIAPSVPANLVAAYNTGSGNQLSWDPAPEEDFQYYRVYRDSDPNFVPSLLNFVEGTIATNWTDPDYDGGVVYYKISAVDDADNESDPALPGSATAVPDAVVPEAFALHQNYPNPFNPTTVIRYDVPRGGAEVTLRIYNVSGGLVRTLVDGPRAEGRRTATWDGRDSGGRRVAGRRHGTAATAAGGAWRPGRISIASPHPASSRHERWFC